MPRRRRRRGTYRQHGGSCQAPGRSTPFRRCNDHGHLFFISYQCSGDCDRESHTVVRRILLSGDHLLGMEQVPVDTGPDLIDHIGLQVDVDCSRNVLSLTCRRRTPLEYASKGCLPLCWSSRKLRRAAKGRTAPMTGMIAYQSRRKRC